MSKTAGQSSYIHFIRTTSLTTHFKDALLVSRDVTPMTGCCTIAEDAGYAGTGYVCLSPAGPARKPGL